MSQSLGLKEEASMRSLIALVVAPPGGHGVIACCSSREAPSSTSGGESGDEGDLSVSY
jgi:hypothetical protein